MSEPPVSRVEGMEHLRLDPARPLIVTDADEVLFYFLEGLEAFMHLEDLYYDNASYALSGNIRRRADNVALDRPAVTALIDRFFAARTEHMRPVDEAAATLSRLSERAQVVVLSNLPHSQRLARQRSLRAHGMDYPLLTNTGTKGGALRTLTDQMTAPLVFIDDIGQHHVSVKEEAPATLCIHYIADERLRRHAKTPECCDHSVASWAEIETAVSAWFAQHGF